MNLDEYIKVSYDDDRFWFADECNKPNHTARISNAWRHKDYLMGRHKILFKEDGVYKGKAYVTSKTILQYAKTLITFHNSLLVGKPVSIVSPDEESQKDVTKVYKDGGYESTDYDVMDDINKYGDAYEYVYFDNGVIKSKVFDPCESYPVIAPDGSYVAFVENWRDSFTAIAYWNVYTEDRVDNWTDAGGEIHLIGSSKNVSGLPIHYHNKCDEDRYFGRSILDDIVPVLDEIEATLGKFGDAIYCLSMNPMPVATGQRIESSIPADAVGYILNMDNGNFDFKNATMDYNSIKLYLEQMRTYLNDVSCFPSALSGNAQIANVSSVSLKLLMALAMARAYENEKYLQDGFKERMDKIRKILSMQGKSVSDDITVEFNINMPTDDAELMNAIATMRNLGAMSVTTAMEKSGMISDVQLEKERLEDEPETNLGVSNFGMNDAKPNNGGYEKTTRD